MIALCMLAAGLPTTTGAWLAIGKGRDEAHEKQLEQEVHLTIYCASPTSKRKQLHGKSVLMGADGKVVVGKLPPKGRRNPDDLGHPFKGFCVGYPHDDGLRGIVSLSAESPPAMSFVYADKETLELRYGNKSASINHIVGDWDVTADGEGMSLEDEELFVAVEEEPKKWALYYDRNGDGTGLPQGKSVLPVSLERRPKELLD